MMILLQAGDASGGDILAKEEIKNRIIHFS